MTRHSRSLQFRGGFSTGLSIAAKSTFIADRQNTAQSIAQSQIESIKYSDYIDFSETGHDDYALITTPSGYSVAVTTTPLDPDDGQALPTGEDEGLQKITVTVSQNSETVLTLEDYKVER